MNVPVALALVMGEKWLTKYDTAKQLGKLQVLDARRIAYADHADVSWCKFHQPLEDRVTSEFALLPLPALFDARSFDSRYELCARPMGQSSF